MKRTNLVLDEKLLKETVRVFGCKTYSEAVNSAMSEALRVKRVQEMFSLFGAGWDGDLAEMREDKPRRPAKAGSRK